MESFETIFNPGAMAVFKLVFIAFFCCHLFGCMWWLISDVEMKEEESGVMDAWVSSAWYSGDNTWHPPHWLKSDASLSMKYLHSFFWGAGMITSLVPRDIEPVTVLEALATTLTMFVGLLLNAFVIGSLTQALASMNSKRELAGKQLAQVKHYLMFKGVATPTRNRILKFYDYLFTSNAAIDDLSALDHMPPALNAQLALSANRRLVARCALLHDVTNASLVQIVSELTALVFVPNQTILREGSTLEALYLINKGLVQLTVRGRDGVDVPHGTLAQHDNFGFDDYQTAAMHRHPSPKASKSANAVTFVDVMSLNVAAIDAVVRNDAKFQDAMRAKREGLSEPDVSENKRRSGNYSKLKNACQAVGKLRRGSIAAGGARPRRAST